ncbi:MAG: tRNA 4-thiouridine(8) synthase ThiI [Nitrospinae bacterium]|nr:tRNA 4-thiouridine(8) synthase ThiI [Nitrospinota bacterium]MDA1110799.1 tRNA 4-thiouridine(8) synthase ThiI [Nitrospinota bacterium]
MNEARTLLIRYDEIGLKGRNRKFFENCLLDNIKKALQGLEGLRFRVPRGRIVIDTTAELAEECSKCLAFVPGIASFSIGYPVNPDFEEMAALGIQRLETRMEAGKGFKFCVRTQRNNKLFPKTSPEINFEVGSRIMAALSDKGLTVSLNEAEVVIEIEMGQKETVLFDHRIPGIRGLPVGCSGEVLSLLSGGIDSPVASFYMMRRGCRVHFIFFDNQPFLGRGGHDKVLKLGKILNRYQSRGRIYVVPFQDIQVAIRGHCSPENRVVLYRRMMYRIGEAMAEKIKCLGLVTGESLGQVASQTLENLAAVSSVVTTSVFRPLIGLDKQYIIAEAKKIATYPISIEQHPDCCSVFMPSRPATRSKKKKLERDESSFPWKDLMQEAMDKTEVVKLDSQVAE